MDGKYRITLAFIIVFVVLIGGMLASCGKAEESDVVKNSYEEARIDLPEEIGTVYDLCESGNMLLITAFDRAGEVGRVWKSEDSGETWTKLSAFTDLIRSHSAITAGNDQERAAYLSKTGEVFVIIRNWLNDEEAVEEYFLTGDGESRAVHPALPQKGKTGNGIHKAVFSDDGALIVEDRWGQLYQIDKDTGAIVNRYLPDESPLIINDFAVAGDDLFVLTSEDFLTYSLRTGKQTKKTASAEKMINETKSDRWSDGNAARKIVASGADARREFTYIDANGIVHFAKDGSSEKLIDGSDTCMYGGKPTLYDFERTEDDALFLIVQERSGSALYRYEKAKGDGKESGNKAELTLFTLKANEDLEMLIRLYRDSNPEVKITLRTGITEEQNIPVSDALRLLNTDLLSGQGPDIICFDNINYSAFAENRMLLDLSPTIQDVSRTENLYSNILNAYKGGDGLYVIPTKFSFPGIVGPADLVDANGDLTALNERLAQMYAQNNKPPVFDGQYFDKAVRIFYQAYVVALTGENNVPTQMQLETFYKTVKTLDDICGGREARKKDKRNDIKGLIPYSDQEALRVIAGLNQISIQDVMGVRDMQALFTVKGRDGLRYGPLRPNGINLFVGQNMLGVNANSKYKEKASKFVAFSLGKDAQNRIRPPAWENGFPVNKDALSEPLENAEIAGPVIMNEKNEDIQIAYKAFTTEDIAEILAFPDQLTVPAHSDLILYAIVTDSLEKYLADEISLKDIVNTTASKLDLYIKEGR